MIEFLKEMEDEIDIYADLPNFDVGVNEDVRIL